MKYKINYASQVTVIPRSALDGIKRAGAAEMKVLFCLCSNDGNGDVKKISKMSLCSEDEVRDALAFWRGVGVIESCDEQADTEKTLSSEDETAVVEEAENKKSRKSAKPLRNDELPIYTADELADLLQKRTETATLIDECQRIVGKIFNIREVNIIIGLLDHLDLECEYIMILLTYCQSIGKKSLRYAEKLAMSLYDADICTSEQLAEEISRRERAVSIEGRIRSMFGIGERSFTTKEKKFLISWVGDMGYSEEIIQKAYEVTVNATGKASLPYANSVLERWYSLGLKSLEDIEESYSKSEGADNTKGSFDTDDFFEAAIKRSLGEN